MKKITSNFYNADYYKMQTQQELTNKTIPFIRNIPVENKNVLEIGCGSGQYLEMIRDRVNLCCGFDYSKAALSICKEKKLDCVFRACADKIPIKPNTFDVVLLIDVVEHLYYHEFINCVIAVANILKPDGIVAIKTPHANKVPYIFRKIHNKLRGFELGKGGEGHVNEMILKQMLTPFIKSGFVVEELNITTGSHYPRVNRFLGYRLGGSVTVILRKK